MCIYVNQDMMLLCDKETFVQLHKKSHKKKNLNHHKNKPKKSVWVFRL
jgi:hypothetical protein